MKKILGSFRIRILLSFLVLKLVLISWLVFYYQLSEDGKQIKAVRSDLKQIELSMYAVDANFQRFVLNGRTDSSFLANSNKTITEFIANQQQLQNTLNSLEQKLVQHNIHQVNELNRVKQQSLALSDSVGYMFSLLNKRGFVDFGKEGVMRDYAHRLETVMASNRADVLLLRRHEKDFFLRHQPVYVEKFNGLVDDLLTQGNLNRTAEELVSLYAKEFNQIVALENRLGISDNTNLYQNINYLFSEAKINLFGVITATTQAINLIEHRINKDLILITIIALAIAVGLSFYLTFYLTKDLRGLNKYVLSKGANQGKNAVLNSRISEITQLQENFDKLWRAHQKNLKKLKRDKDIAEKATEAKARFLANMSHEIRTPLNGVVGMLYALKSTSLTDEQTEQIEVIEFSANHLMNIVNMVLDHSKIEAGRMEIENTQFNLISDTENLCRMFKALLNDKPVELNCEIDSSISDVLLGDPLRLQQILINLINNAIKFTEKGTVKLFVQKLKSKNQLETLRFTVSDSGIGIAEHKIEKLFDAFTQSDVSITRQYGGTGLGLTISSALVKLMGGQLQVKSEIGKGSTFWFDLDFEAIKQPTPLPKGPALPILKAVADELHVLVAEDNEVNQRVICFMLQRFGVSVKTANNGLEAVNMYNDNAFDLILMDFQMPELDGFEATKLIINSNKFKKQPIPIIGVSANAFKEDKMKALEAGMIDFLAKPVKIESLKAIFDKFTTKSATA